MKTNIHRSALGTLTLIVSVAAPAWAASSDIVVYGGVPCGIASAITAAREGDKVVLIEPTMHVGGLSTSGINTAETEHMLKWTIGGFADEFYRRLGRHYGTGQPEYYFESSVAERVYLDMLKEAGVEVRYGASVDKVTKDGSRITGITLTDGAKLEARIFIDASYEGDLMARAGVSFAVGRESKREFGEEAAGIRFDKTPRQARTVDEDGRLLKMLRAGHNDVHLSDSDLRRLAAWIDCNAVFHGTFNAAEQAKQLAGERLGMPEIQ